LWVPLPIGSNTYENDNIILNKLDDYFCRWLDEDEDDGALERVLTLTRVDKEKAKPSTPPPSKGNPFTAVKVFNFNIK
jgi:hypothetical protein